MVLPLTCLAVLFAFGAVIMIAEVRRAPKGRQDRTGFHYNPTNTPADKNAPASIKPSIHDRNRIPGPGPLQLIYHIPRV